MGAAKPFDFDAKSVSFASDARRFTQSTMSYVSIAGLTVSIEQLLSLGENRIEEHARQLAAMLVDGAREYGWEPFHDVYDVAASDTAGRAYGKPWRNSATRGLYVRRAANGSEYPLLLTTMQVT